MKRILTLSALMLGTLAASAQNVTLTGTLQSSNGLPAKNYTIQFTPTQFGFIAGTGVLVNTTTTCATSTDGTVVGISNPTTTPIASAIFSGGTVPFGSYNIQIAWQTATGGVTLVSPELPFLFSGVGRLLVAPPPSGTPAGVTFMNVYIGGSTSGSETYQGQVAAGGTYVQTTPIVTGSAVPAANTTTCTQVANDVIWPFGTGYKVSLTTLDGSSVPGYPMIWQLLGAGSTINLSNGLPYYHGVVTFPTPILASPFNHALQSIASDLNLQGYTLRNVGVLGIATSFPAWPIDVELGASGWINASGGFRFNGTAGYTGTKTAGACVLTIQGGIITNVTGC